jgi:Uma2 family endonuclease
MIMVTVADYTLRDHDAGDIMRLMTLYTAEEFCEMDWEDKRGELVRGVLQVREAPTRPHAHTAMEIGYAIRKYLETHPIGLVFQETGYTTERRPDTVRIPDVSFVTHRRLEEMPVWKPADAAPDLAVEVLSPSNRPKEVAQKITEYLAKGSRLVWVADPKTRTVAVYAPDARPYVVRSGEFLDGHDLLPGFRAEVKKLFGYPP